MFCGYCGKEIPNGSVCNCEASQRAMAQAQPMTPPPAPQPMTPPAQAQPVTPPPAPQPMYQQGPQGYQQGGYVPNYQQPAPMPKPPKTGPSAIELAWKTFLEGFKRPEGLMEEALADKTSTKGAIGTGIIYAICMFFGLFLFFIGLAGFGKALLFGFLLSLFFAATRFGIAALCFAFGKKNGITLIRSLKAACVVTVPFSALVLLLGLFGLFAPTIALILMLCWIVYVVIANYRLMKLVLPGEAEKAFWFNAIIVAVYLVVLFIIYKITLSILVRALLSSSFSLGGFGGLGSFF